MKALRVTLSLFLTLALIAPTGTPLYAFAASAGQSLNSTETACPLAGIDSNLASDTPTTANDSAHETLDYVPGEIIVQFEEVATKSRRDVALERAKAKSSQQISPYGKGRAMAKFDVGVERDIEEAIAAFESLPGVVNAEPNYIRTLASLPNDPAFSNLWGLNNTGQSANGTAGLANADIDAPAAWGITAGSEDIVVAVLDTGIDLNHPDLKNNLWVNPGEIAGNGIDDDPKIGGKEFIDDVHGWNFLSGTANVHDDNGHGTHVAGTIAAEANNGVGIAGVAPNVKIMTLKVLDSSGSGPISAILAALEYANAHGADVINGSFGSARPNYSFEYEALQKIPVPLVFAAGNEANNNDTVPFYPASYNLPNIIAVGATDSKDAFAAFSNYGASSVDVFAPGQSIYSTKPASLTGPSSPAAYGSAYKWMSGTSMAAPHVAGVAALLLSVDSGLSPSQVKSAVMGTVDKKSELTGKGVTGGRVNAHRALLEVTAVGTINGSIRCNVSSSGLSGASIRVASNGTVVTSDTLGRYSIPELAVGTHELVVTHAGYQDTVVSVDVAEAYVTTANVRLLPAVADLTGSVGGLVTASGSPVAGALVEVLGVDLATTTGADGRYTIGGIHADSYDIRISRAGYNTQTIPAVVSSGLATTVDVQLVARTSLSFSTPASMRWDRTTALSGYLRNDSGTGVAGKAITIERSLNGGTTWSRLTVVTTAASGRWAFTYNPSTSWERPQRLRVRFVGDGAHAASTSAARTLKVTIGLSKPTLSVSTPRVNRTFTVRSYAAPRFKTGVKPARALFYKKQSNGTWKYIKGVTLTTSYYSTSRTRITAKPTLPSAGNWRVRIRYDGAKTYRGYQLDRSYSSYLYFKVSR